MMLWRISLILMLALQPALSVLEATCASVGGCVEEVARACDCCCGGHDGGACPCIAEDDAPPQPQTPQPATTPDSRITIFLPQVATQVVAMESTPSRWDTEADHRAHAESQRALRTRKCVWQT
jgi:hypothetical protein